MFNDLTRRRLELLIPRLASEADVVSTVRAIVRQLATEGKDLHDLARVLTAAPVEKIVFRDRPGQGPHHPQQLWAMKAKFCSLHVSELSPRETEFVYDMAAELTYKEPTPNQAAWLEKIYTRLQRKHGNAAG